jgi:hypothetical protein
MTTPYSKPRPKEHDLQSSSNYKKTYTNIQRVVDGRKEDTVNLPMHRKSTQMK